MPSLDLAEMAIIEIIATARIIMAIVPNSGITKVPMISITSVPLGNEMVRILSVGVTTSSNSTSSPSISTKNVSSSPLFFASITVLGRVIISSPSGRVDANY